MVSIDHARKSLLGLAFRDEELARRLTQLPVEVFGMDERHTIILAAIREQLPHSPYALTEDSLEAILRLQQKSPAYILAIKCVYRNCDMLACAPSDVPSFLELVHQDYGKRKVINDLRSKRITIEEAKQQLITRRERPFTDQFNAEMFVDLHGHDLRYVEEWRSWIAWNGQRWESDRSGSAARRIAMRFVAQDLYNLASAFKSRERRQAFTRHIAKSQSRHAIDNLISLASTILSLKATALDADGWLFNCENGTIELKTGNLREHRREDLITKIAPVKHDPTASSPTWDAFLARIFQDCNGEVQNELIEYVQQAAGYSLTTDTSEQCFFLLHGCGRNGKTTFVEALRHAMGDYALVAQDSVLLKYDRTRTNNDDEASLFRVRFAACSETNEGQRFDESKVKRLTGNSEITAMRKYEHPVTFKTTWKIWLDCNHLPKISGTDLAIWRRVKTVPFSVVIPLEERDTALPAKLRAEASGILNWCLEGLRQWQRHGLTDAPAQVTAALREYHHDNDTLGQFLSETVVNNDAARVETAVLYSRYKTWCQENGLEYPLSQIALGRKLKERGYGSAASNGKRYVIGMELSDSVSQEQSASIHDMEEQPF